MNNPPIGLAIARHFSLDYNTEDSWVAILCPFHNDSSESAAVNFRYNVFTCRAGCDNRSFTSLASELSIRYATEQELEQDEDWLSNLIGEIKIPKRKLKQQV